MNEIIDKAVGFLKKGDVIAVPTEAVFGLSCDPDSFSAVKKLLALKQRDLSKGLILVSDDISRLLPYIYPLTAAQQQQLLTTWPGPVTWVVPKATTLPEWISGEHNTVAIRVTAHPMLRKLCATFGKPLISSSANKSNESPAKTAAEVRIIFEKTNLAYILEGNVGNQTKPTQIRDLLTGQVLRE